MVAGGRGGGLCVKGELEGVERVRIVNRRGGGITKEIHMCTLYTCRFYVLENSSITNTPLYTRFFIQWKVSQFCSLIYCVFCTFGYIFKLS